MSDVTASPEEFRLRAGTHPTLVRLLGARNRRMQLLEAKQNAHIRSGAAVHDSFRNWERLASLIPRTNRAAIMSAARSSLASASLYKVLLIVAVGVLSFQIGRAHV